MTEPTKKCPDCGEEVLSIARKCKHCQSLLLLNSDVIKKRDLGIIVLLLVVTIGFYGFYLIPDFGRGVNIAIGRRKYSFALILLLGIITLGIALSVFEIMFAYDLERSGQESDFKKRVQNLGSYVMILNIISWIVAFASGGFAFIVSCILGIWATWLIQKELNFLAERQVKTVA